MARQLQGINKIPNKQQTVKAILICSVLSMLFACSDAAKKTTPPPLKIPLAVASTYPVDTAQSIPSNTMITVLFNTPINKDSLNTDNVKLYKTGDQGSPLDISLEYSNDVAFIRPVALEPNTGYTVEIAAAVADATGRTLDDTYRWQFTTGPDQDNTPPTITLHSPQDQDIPINADIIVNFNEVIDLNSVTILLNDAELVVNGTVKTGRQARFSHVPCARFGADRQPLHGLIV